MSLYDNQAAILQNEINRAAGRSWKYIPEPISDNEGDDDMDDYDHLYSYDGPPGAQESAIATTTDGAHDEAEVTMLDFSGPATELDTDVEMQNGLRFKRFVTSDIDIEMQDGAYLNGIFASGYNVNDEVDNYINGFTIKYDSSPSCSTSSSTSNLAPIPNPATTTYYQPTKQEIAQHYLIWARRKLTTDYPWLCHLCPTNELVPAVKRGVYRQMRDSSIACMLRGLRGVVEIGWGEDVDMEEQQEQEPVEEEEQLTLLDRFLLGEAEDMEF